jgi:phage tail sheath protein FI
MPEYLSPGVYVEEVDAGPKPIEGVSTSTTGAVGVTERGPSGGTAPGDTTNRGKPVLVTSFADFTRIFGGFLPEPPPNIVNKWALDPSEGGRWWLFPLSVKGFFDNGGQRLYVKRVFAGGLPGGASATAATAALGTGVTSEVTHDAGTTDRSVRIQHLFGIQNGSNITIVAGGSLLAPAAPFVVNSYDAATGTINLNQALGQELKAGRDFVVIVARTAPAAGAAGPPVVPDSRTLTFTAKSAGDWGGNSNGDYPLDGIRARVRPMVGGTFRILGDPATGGNAQQTSTTADAGPNTVALTVASIVGFANGDHVLIRGHRFAIDAVPAGTTLHITPAVPAGVTWAAGTPILRLRPANNAGAPAAIHVQGAEQLYQGALVELDNGTNKERATVDSVVGDLVTLSQNLAQPYLEGNRMRVIEAEILTRYEVGGVVQAEERFQNLHLVDDGTMNFLVTQINSRSQLVDVVTQPGFSDTLLQDFPAAPPPAAGQPDLLWQRLDGGDNHLELLAVDDFVGVDRGSGARTGIQALEDIDEVSICAVPNIWSTTVQSALITHCESLRYRFAILDPQDGLSIEGIQTFREPLDTKYAALYYPWVEVRDPSVQRNVQVGPSGHMAGIYARVDVQRGVHKAPANEVIESITKISQDVNKREQDILNPKNINALRFFPNRGNRVWGARVVTSDSAWKYINVRRLFIYVEASIDYGTQWVVFEPNDEPLWARVRLSITNFLTSTWRSGALQGAKPADAFFVKCDHTTMTQDDIDNGRLICVIGIAPVKPAEFVIFRIQQKTMEIQAS